MKYFSHLLIFEFLGGSLVIRLSTVSDEGAPHVIVLRRLRDLRHLIVRYRKVADAGRSIGRAIVVALVLVRILLVVIRHILVVHHKIELGLRLSQIDRRGQEWRLTLQLVPRVDVLMVPGQDSHVHVIDPRHFDTLLLLELAKVLLEPLAIIIDVDLVADRLHGVRICLVHFADWAIDKSSRAHF